MKQWYFIHTYSGHENKVVESLNARIRDMGLADRPGFDLSRRGGRSPSHRTSEPWLVHNVFYLLATSQWENALKRSGRVALGIGVGRSDRVSER